MTFRVLDEIVPASTMARARGKTNLSGGGEVTDARHLKIKLGAPWARHQVLLDRRSPGRLALPASQFARPQEDRHLPTPFGLPPGEATDKAICTVLLRHDGLGPACNARVRHRTARSPPATRDPRRRCRPRQAHLTKSWWVPSVRNIAPSRAVNLGLRWTERVPGGAARALDHALARSQVIGESMNVPDVPRQ